VCMMNMTLRYRKSGTGSRLNDIWLVWFCVALAGAHLILVKKDSLEYKSYHQELAYVNHQLNPKDNTFVRAVKCSQDTPRAWY
jgi:hypothetical protein